MSPRPHRDAGGASTLRLNFIPERVHGARLGGKGFTDRQRIKRKAKSWARRYRATPAP